MNTIKNAVPIGIVAAEENGVWVPIDDDVVGSNGCQGRPVPKVLAVDAAFVAPVQDVVLCMLDEGDRLLQGSGKLALLGGVAAVVDGKGRYNRVFQRGRGLLGWESRNGGAQGQC